MDYTSLKTAENLLGKRIENINKEVGENYKELSSPRFLSGLVMNLLYFVVLIFLNICSVGFSLEAILTIQFWTKIGTNIILLILAYHGTINMLFDFQERRKIVKESKEEYINKNNKTNKTKLDDYLLEFNSKTKIEYYLYSLNKKIAKVKKKLSICKNDKKTKKLTAKLEDLKLKKSTEYIEANIDDMEIKYPIVRVSDFNEFSYDSNVNCLKTRSDFNKNVSKSSFKGAISLIIYTAFFGLLVINNISNLGASFWFSLVSTIFVQIMRIFNATRALPGLYDSSITITYTTRSNILDQYNLWLNENPDLVYSKMLNNVREEIKEELKEEVGKEYEMKLASKGYSLVKQKDTI